MLQVYVSFKEAGVNVECISPQSVTSFFQTHNTGIPGVCNMVSLPAAIGNTPFKVVTTLQTVIQYCIQVRRWLSCGSPSLSPCSNHEKSLDI